MRRVLLAVSAVLVMGSALVALPTPASAFLDFLFGRPQAPAPAPTYQSRPLDVSVDPRRRARGDRHFKKQLGRRKDDKSKPQHAKAENGEKRAPARGQVQRSIDPVANPDWFLKDPNIRYGDILVLKTGAVVYQGSRSTRAREDFVSLGKSSIVSTASLRNIGMMVSGVWIPPDPGATPPKKLRRTRR